MKLCHCVAILIISVAAESENVAFNNVSVSTLFEHITTIETGNSLKDFLPERTLETVVVSGRIPVLLKGSAAGIRDVEELQFLRNGIEEMEPGAFANSTFLGLSIVHSRLKRVKDGVFCNIPVKEVQVRFNRLNAITKNSFNLPNLTFLGLTNNEIETLEDNALDLVPQLEVLELSSNRIQKIPAHFFKNLPNLRMVSLKSNRIELSSEAFTSASIQYLDLTNNSISTIPEHFFKQLPKTNRIILSHNRLTTIPKNIFNGNKVLQQVELNNNQISSIDPQAFDDMPNLANVLLSSNKIASYNTDWFSNTPNIYRLFLSYNLIEELPDAFLKNIYNHKKQWIKLDKNRIKTVSAKTFKGFKKINNLNLSHNEIEVWDDKVLEDAELVDFVNLIYNKIGCPVGDFGGIFKANVTYMTGNPLTGECLERIKKWNVENPGKKVCAESLLC